jgi:hypothetical protein
MSLQIVAKNGFSILSKYNFHYATCKYCPGGFWPDPSYQKWYGIMCIYEEWMVTDEIL